VNHPAAAPLYRHAGVVVTRDLFQVGDRRYRVAALRRLRTARGAQGPVTLVMAVLAAAVLAAVGVAVSFGRQPSGPGRETYLVLLAAVLTPATIFGYGRVRARRRHELWGEYQGETVLLYACPDEREFGQVTRALLRAHESRRA
jgi:hypothetical protein